MRPLDSCKDCLQIKIKDILPLIFNDTTYIITFDAMKNVEEEFACSRLSMKIMLKQIDNADEMKEIKVYE